MVACLSAHIAAAVDAADGWGVRAGALGRGSTGGWQREAGSGQRAASWRERDQDRMEQVSRGCDELVRSSRG